MFDLYPHYPSTVPRSRNHFNNYGDFTRDYLLSDLQRREELLERERYRRAMEEMASRRRHTAAEERFRQKQSEEERLLSNQFRTPRSPQRSPFIDLNFPNFWNNTDGYAPSASTKQHFATAEDNEQESKSVLNNSVPVTKVDNKILKHATETIQRAYRNHLKKRRDLASRRISAFLRRLVARRAAERVVKSLLSLKSLESQLAGLYDHVHTTVLNKPLTCAEDGRVRPVKDNEEYLATEEAVMKLLLKMDDILSFGSDIVREKRKKLVHEAQRLLEILDKYRMDQFAKERHITMNMEPQLAVATEDSTPMDVMSTGTIADPSV